MVMFTALPFGVNMEGGSKQPMIVSLSCTRSSHMPLSTCGCRPMFMSRGWKISGFWFNPRVRLVRLVIPYSLKGGNKEYFCHAVVNECFKPINIFGISFLSYKWEEIVERLGCPYPGGTEKEEEFLIRFNYFELFFSAWFLCFCFFVNFSFSLLRFRGQATIWILNSASCLSWTGCQSRQENPVCLVI